LAAAAAVLAALAGGASGPAAAQTEAAAQPQAAAVPAPQSWIGPAVAGAAGGTLLFGLGFLLGRRRERRALSAVNSGLERSNASLEARLDKRNLELEGANRELDAYAYAVSHDLRAPLRTINGFARLLAEHPGTAIDDQAQHYLDRIHAGVETLTASLDDLLALSRATRGTLRHDRVNMTALAETAAAELGQRHPHRAVDVRIAPDMTAWGDGRLLFTVLKHALDNAWKFTDGRSMATIEVGAEERDGETEFHVRDNGAGFDMAYVDKLFTPFRRLHGPEEFPGGGMGLAIIQNIVRRHGGRAWIEGVADGGATLSFTLPHRGSAS
jgi:light-regulated signal transduction histidine kinase (bacteriophytochrome)